jgi:hypothetical protein
VKDNTLLRVLSTYTPLVATLLTVNTALIVFFDVFIKLF